MAGWIYAIPRLDVVPTSLTASMSVVSFGGGHNRLCSGLLYLWMSSEGFAGLIELMRELGHL